MEVNPKSGNRSLTEEQQGPPAPMPRADTSWPFQLLELVLLLSVSSSKGRQGQEKREHFRLPACSVNHASLWRRQRCGQVEMWGQRCGWMKSLGQRPSELCPDPALGPGGSPPREGQACSPGFAVSPGHPACSPAVLELSPPAMSPIPGAPAGCLSTPLRKTDT